MGATFINGEHYLVDAIGHLIRLKESAESYIHVPNREKSL